MPVVEVAEGRVVSGFADEDRGVLPVSAVRKWAAEGFRGVHLSARDALDAGPTADAVADVIRDAAADIQVSGEIASGDVIQHLLDIGSARLVVGARGVDDAEWLDSTAHAFPGSLLLELIVTDRRVVARGSRRRPSLDVFDFVDELDALPLIGAIIRLTDGAATRDLSTLGLLEDLVEAAPWPLLAAGGIDSMNALRALENRGVAGVLLDGTAAALDSREVAREFGG